MSFQAKTNQIISAVGSGINALENANMPTPTKIQATAQAVQRPVKPSYDQQVAEMANKLAQNLIVSKNNQKNNFNDYLKKISSGEWFELAVQEEKNKNKLSADALMKNALDAEAMERSEK